MSDHLFHHRDESYRTLALWEEKYRVKAGITTRNGGVSSDPYATLNVGFHVEDCEATVLHNRTIIARKLSIPLKNWVIGNQPHSTLIQKVTRKEAGKGATKFSTSIEGVDGLYTDVPELLLVSLYADCVPLYFYAEKHCLIGIAHAGWRGTIGMIGSKMVQAWQNEGVALSEIKVVIGPSIRRCCYEVDDAVMSHVTNLQLEDNCISDKKPNQRYMLDLPLLNKLLLVEAGVSEDAILISEDCTSCLNDQYYSHRKENGKTGRMMAYIGRCNETK